MAKFHLAQVNIARLRAPLDSPLMADFVARLGEINALAESSAGFVWRFKDEVYGKESYARLFDGESLLFNMSVWESVEALKEYTYRSVHKELVQQRHQWFDRMETPALALWWIETGQLPTPDDAKQRLDHLAAHGETPFAFNFRKTFEPESGSIVQHA